ncbi:MAG: phage holin family protein [Anaerolineae bacterium]|nr:phage holin family protein [Gemmatimonadaceae bacterium]
MRFVLSSRGEIKVTERRVEIDPDATIGGLVRQLKEDSTRLLRNEFKLAKVEIGENIKAGAWGVLWLALAFGVGVIALVAVTIALASGIGKLANGNMWVGAIAAGVLEIGLGGWLVYLGMQTFGKPSYTLGESREELVSTKGWIERQRGG